MTGADGEKRGSDHYEDRAGEKTPATSSKMRCRRHCTEMDGQVLHRQQQRHDAQIEGAPRREGAKSVARRLAWEMSVDTAAPEAKGGHQAVPRAAPSREGGSATDGSGVGAAGGDDRLQTGTEATGGSRVAPPLQLTRCDAQGKRETDSRCDMGSGGPAGIAVNNDERVRISLQMAGMG